MTDIWLTISARNSELGSHIGATGAIRTQSDRRRKGWVESKEVGQSKNDPA